MCIGEISYIYLIFKKKTKTIRYLKGAYRVYLQSTGIQYVSDAGKSPILVYPGFIDFCLWSTDTNTKHDTESGNFEKMV